MGGTSEAVCRNLARCLFLPPAPLPPLFFTSALILGPLVELEGVGHLGRREKLFQKCPVAPAEEGALFSLLDDAG